MPGAIYRPIRRWWRRNIVARGPAEPPTALKPISRIWGLDRGTPIDHYYMQQFLSNCAADVQGHTLELGDPRYTRKFGAGRVTKSDVLHLAPGNPQATMVGNLATGANIPSEAFDCMIVMNALLLIYDVRAAIANCYAALKPGGVLLAQFTGIASRCPSDPAWEDDYWRFTSASARRLCEEVFQPANVKVHAYGNVRTATAYLYGLAIEDLKPEEVNYHDPDYELVILARAVKPARI